MANRDTNRTFHIYSGVFNDGTKLGTAVDVETAVTFANAIGCGTSIRYGKRQVWHVYNPEEDVRHTVDVINHRIANIVWRTS